jgi:hypothetical protein
LEVHGHNALNMGLKKHKRPSGFLFKGVEIGKENVGS